MIPYVFLDEIIIGPITLHFWGIMVALGFLVGLYANYFFAKKDDFNTDYIFDLGFWVILSSIIGARLFHVLFYNLEYYINNPISIFKVWEGGMAITGGFLVAFCVGVLFFRKNKIKFWPNVDYFIFGLPLGLAIGRIGCAFIHDHPGIKSDFFLAVNYPGGARHDLGLYLVFLNILIFIFFLIFKKKSQNNGFLFLSFLLFYGIGRFLLDFLRVWNIDIADQRYLNLTPAQWVFLGVVFYAFYAIIKRNKKK